jgi:hypothetical protein
MRYYYKCDKRRAECCKISDLPDRFFKTGLFEQAEIVVENRLTELTEDGLIDGDNSPLVWAVEHKMVEKPEVKCPICENGAVVIINKAPNWYWRGDCYANKADCQKQMNIHKLKTNDPYGYMRQPGEVDDMINKIKRGNKSKPKHFHSSK